MVSKNVAIKAAVYWSTHAFTFTVHIGEPGLFIKGTLSRDFRPPVLFIKQLHLGP
jgi:hypothetical protein